MGHVIDLQAGGAAVLGWLPRQGVGARALDTALALSARSRLRRGRSFRRLRLTLPARDALRSNDTPRFGRHLRSSRRSIESRSGSRVFNDFGVSDALTKASSTATMSH